MHEHAVAGSAFTIRVKRTLAAISGRMERDASSEFQFYSHPCAARRAGAVEPRPFEIIVDERPVAEHPEGVIARVEQVGDLSDQGYADGHAVAGMRVGGGKAGSGHEQIGLVAAQ